MPNIPEVVRNEKTLKTLDKGVTASSLGKFLRGRGPYTVFAPSDSAFNKLGKDNVEELLKPENKLRLDEFLNRHIIGHRINFKDLKDGDKLKTMAGKEVTVTVKGKKVSIDSAVILIPDVQSSNGVIHKLDSVLIN
ncbi:fasciclin domain-containing protein [Ilyomonas limi]|uniref:Fasciclin domain-containing protein n=1 Tax=Ilyomonas limi TaxID=2575867 RepID=A0A4U3KRW6_9BACT|nr:fasciclin domain-containing protein [Ilyomonas limi]TKK64194.1 fasciclin domain-containing protein [Ilyomonas limi]